jgi:Tfp pilus assembly protein PilP
VKSSLALMVLLAAVLLVGCGGSSQSWKDEFTSQVEAVIGSTKMVGKAMRSASGPKDLRGPYGKYNEELLPAKEKLEELESAPSACAEAEKHALGQVRQRVFASREIADPKNYTPTLLENAKARPPETVKKLERDLSEARC